LASIDVQKTDARVFASLAFVAWGLVAWWRSTLTTDVGVGLLAVTHLAQGVGIGLFLTPLVTLSLAGLPPDRLAAASGLQTAIRMMTGSLVASLAQTFWDQRSRFYQNRLVDTLTPFHERVAATFDTFRQGDVADERPWVLIWRQVVVQADMLSLNDFFLLSTYGFALSVGIVWLAHAQKQVR
jgi:MFS transporter, DHA2 family, multidrug resistance protein